MKRWVNVHISPLTAVLQPGPFRLMHAGPVCSNFFRLIVYFEKCRVHNGNVLFAFAFYYFGIHWICVCHQMGTDFCNSLFLLYKTSFNMKNIATVGVINVMYYSTAFSFSNDVSYFYAFVLYIFLLEWSCRANNAALFFTYSHVNLLFKTISFI